MKTAHLQECPCHATHSLICYQLMKTVDKLLVVNLHIAVTLLIRCAQCMCDTLHNMLLRHLLPHMCIAWLYENHVLVNKVVMHIVLFLFLFPFPNLRG